MPEHFLHQELVHYDASGNIVISGLRGERVQHTSKSLRTDFSAGYQSLARTTQRMLRSLQQASTSIASVPKRFSSLTRSLPKVKVPMRAHVLLSSGRFLVRFAMTFAALFVLLNAQSFFAIIRARVLPDADLKARTALEAITQDGSSASSLLAVPSLPTAGRHLSRVLAEKLRVAPPDNRLIIPALAENVPLVEATDAALRRGDFKTFENDMQDALRFGVVRYPGTALPGQPGNVFITGHSAYVFWDDGRFKDVFARLSELEPGDSYAMYYSGKLYHYRITKKFEVSPKNTSVLEQPLDRRMSTLMTCTPVGTTLRRLIIQAEEIDPRTGNVQEVAADSVPKNGVGESSSLGRELPGWGNEGAM